MAKVNWINGTIEPPETGEYYVILEAKEDVFCPIDDSKKIVSAGDIEINTDWWSAKDRQFNLVGRANQVWRILAWAFMLRPDIPVDIAPRVTSYFGVNVKEESGDAR